MNVPEKILFVVDTGRERDCTPFHLSTGASYTPLVMMKRAIGNFVWNKSAIQPSHEYALMTLTSNSVQWVCDFTSDPSSFADRVNFLTEDVVEEEEKLYDFRELFDKIEEKVSSSLPAEVPRDDSTCPSFVVRTILMYSRSNAVPRLIDANKFFTSLQGTFLFVDVLYVHEPPSLENSCEEIFSELAKLDTRGESYVLETGRNAAKLHECMAMLLGHPLLRPRQEDACYAISA